MVELRETGLCYALADDELRALYTQVVASPGKPRLQGRIVYNEKNFTVPGYFVTPLRSMSPLRICKDALPSVCSLEELRDTFGVPIWKPGRSGHVFAYRCAKKETLEKMQQSRWRLLSSCGQSFQQ